MCDNYIVADIMCANGQWTDADPEVCHYLYQTGCHCAVGSLDLGGLIAHVCYSYQMVTKNMLRTCEGKHFFLFGFDYLAIL